MRITDKRQEVINGTVGPDVTFVFQILAYPGVKNPGVSIFSIAASQAEPAGVSPVSGAEDPLVAVGDLLPSDARKPKGLPPMPTHSTKKLADVQRIRDRAALGKVGVV